MTDLTELQKAILHTKRENPDASNKAIAQRVGCSPSYVSQVLTNHGGWELDQMAEEPTTAAEIDREYKPPTRAKAPDWGWLFRTVVLIALVVLVLRVLIDASAL